MATSLPTDMKYFDPLIQTGYTEKITQMIDGFNGQSAGTIVFRSNRKPGDYDYSAFFKNAGGLVSRQDQTSVSDATSIKLTQDQIISVKLNRKIGPVDWSRAAILKPGLDMDAIKVAAGEQAAADALADMLNSSLLAGVAALNNQAAVKYTVPTNGTLNTSSMVSGLSKFGDQANRIQAFVMHSKVFFDLFQYQVTPANNGDLIANTTIVNGGPVTLNRPILVTDSASLVQTGGTGTGAYTNYMTLGLTADGLIVDETEEEYMTFQEITGKEQILMRMQGEFGYNLGVKGFKWDVANGGKNPNAAALGTGSNWDAAFTSSKDFAGCIIQSR
ncbi:major capsid protein [Micavibrio aeruginosavorus]|uniref:Major capsid protein n=1 Tax=Micavibrio aeruginosavorus (strain ARL-13) TaxID=856793 RepID=G2KMW4_MICAA|nr:major capsid protein [Micavibrio aeruginosavorus]AEP08896.1 hypothetical protein MICA_559 [Micavibrio aeruginosavorus ARL-13]